MVRIATIAIVIVCSGTTSVSAAAAAFIGHAGAGTACSDTRPHSNPALYLGGGNNVYDSAFPDGPAAAQRSSTYRPLFDSSGSSKKADVVEQQKFPNMGGGLMSFGGRTGQNQQDQQSVRLSDAGKEVGRQFNTASRTSDVDGDRRRRQYESNSVTPTSIVPMTPPRQGVRLSDVGKDNREVGRRYGNAGGSSSNDEAMPGQNFPVNNDDGRNTFSYSDGIGVKGSSNSNKDVWGGLWKEKQQQQQQQQQQPEKVTMTDSSGGDYYGNPRGDGRGGAPPPGRNRPPNLFEKVSKAMADSSTKTMLKADIAFLEREIIARKQKFGIDVYDVMAQLEYEYEMFIQDNERGVADERERQEAIDAALERMEKDKEFRIRRLFEQARRDVDIYQAKIERKEDEIMDTEDDEERGDWDRDDRPRRDFGNDTMYNGPMNEDPRRSMRNRQQQPPPPPPLRDGPPPPRQRVRLSDLGKDEDKRRKQQGLYDRNVSSPPGAEAPASMPSRRIDEMYGSMAEREDGRYDKPPPPSRGQRLSDVGREDDRSRREFDDPYRRDERSARVSPPEGRMRLSDVGKENDDRSRSEFGGVGRRDNTRPAPRRLSDAGKEEGWSRNEEISDPSLRSDRSRRVSDRDPMRDDYDEAYDRNGPRRTGGRSDIGNEDMYDEMSMRNEYEYDQYDDPMEARGVPNPDVVNGPSRSTSNRIDDRYGNTMDQW